MDPKDTMDDAKDQKDKAANPSQKNRRVKNKEPDPIQITAEQFIREARDNYQEVDFRPPKQSINDPSELADYRLRKRKEFEDKIRRKRWSVSDWVKYATWEESQRDLKSARSIWERVLEIEYRNHSLWLKYAQMEMMNRDINRARNVFDRAVQLLPRVDSIWYKYIHMEETLGFVAHARSIFKRWMNWMPDQKMWLAFINFELRYNEVDRARAIFEEFVQCHPKVEAWIRYAKFEMKNGEVARARNVYERAVGKLYNDDEVESLYMAFGEFEDMCKETERARSIYKVALDHIPKSRAADLYNKFVSFEKRYGDTEGIEDAIVGKKRLEYEDEVRKNPLNYDLWFDYIRLEESAGNKERIREVYERAVANVPPALEKKFWQRYIYLWINYALYEELETGDVERAREVYKECLNLIPHGKFSFAKIWLLAAQFEIRQLDLRAARLTLGSAIGKAPKGKIFKEYIKMEMQLGNNDRCRMLYEKFLEWHPLNCYAWRQYAEFEACLGDTERAREIYALAINQPELYHPESLWKDFIDFELSQCEFDRARNLYEALLNRSKHLKVWISFAKFESSAMVEDGEDSNLEESPANGDLLEQKKQCIGSARRVFERALDYFRTSEPQKKEERAMLLEVWMAMETSFKDLGDIGLVQPKQPKKLKRKRPIETEDCPAGDEEYIDYLFPGEDNTTNLKILEAAYRWKKKQKDSDDDNDN